MFTLAAILFIGAMAILAAFCVFMLWRNELVYAIRMRAIDEVYSRNLWHIYDDGPSYNEMMWCFRKWRFEHFYPGLTDDK